MKHERVSRITRRPVNVSLDSALVSEARELGVNLSRSCENGLSAALKEERDRRWVEENREAMLSNHDWVEKNGIPLEKYRNF